MRLPPALRTALRIVLMLVQIAVLAFGGFFVLYYGLIVGLALLLPKVEIYAYEVEPGPDRLVSLVRRYDLGGGPTSPSPGDVFIVGSTFERPVSVGRYFHGDWESGDGWRDARSVNVCMLRYPFEKPSDAADTIVQVTAGDGRLAKVRVTKACPAEVPNAWSRPAQ